MMTSDELDTLPELTEKVALWQPEDEPMYVRDLRDGQCWAIGYYRKRRWKRKIPWYGGIG